MILHRIFYFIDLWPLKQVFIDFIIDLVNPKCWSFVYVIYQLIGYSTDLFQLSWIVDIGVP
jgi:hypothetical protein